MPVTTGKDRLLGPLTQARIHELRRQAGVGLSEASEEPTDAGSYPRTVDVLRRETTVAAQSSIGLDATWTTVAGLTDLVAHVRTGGRWRDQDAGRDVDIREDERVVLIYDVPEAGDGAAGDVLPSDRLRFDDPIYGASTWEITEVRPRKAAGMANVLCKRTREE